MYTHVQSVFISVVPWTMKLGMAQLYLAKQYQILKSRHLIMT